jgi:polyribonucleotide nucleotidyltransferase
MPEEEKFPYIVRVVSDILESNGSSSMASVCGGSLSLMDAGVPFVKACAGVAMGLIKEGDKVEILTDIQGLEDTTEIWTSRSPELVTGITALQMDNKAGGITREILEAALGQAKEGRLHILGKMDEVLSTPRTRSRPLPLGSPRFRLTRRRSATFIGPGGKPSGASWPRRERRSTSRTTARSSSPPCPRMNASTPSLSSTISSVKCSGRVFAGKVVRMMAFGAFVELLPGKDGLLHVCEVSTHHVPKVDGHSQARRSRARHRQGD